MSHLENSYSFAAIRGIQAGRAFYVAMVPLGMVERLFRYNDQNIPFKLRAQRELNKGRIPAIARYLTENPTGYILSALSATIGGAFAFEPAAGQRSVGKLNV